MRRLLFLALIATACAGQTQEAQGPDEYDALLSESDAPQPDSVEWLYALKDFQGDRRGECGTIHQVLQLERHCAGSACAHAERLGRDWLKLCKEQSDRPVRAALEAQIIEFEQRAAKPPSPCTKQLEEWLTDGCGDGGACLPAAQDWATRCATKIASPLALTMLEQKIETSYASPRRVSLDTRSCDMLAAEMKKAAECRQQFDCEDALPALEVYRAKCVPQGSAMAPDEALSALKLLFIAEKNNRVLVATEPKTLSEQAAPLPLADGSGAVIQICEERPTTLDEYVGAAKGCDNQVLVARFFDAKPHRELRVAWVPHPDADTFARHYPSFMVRGIVTRRDNALLKRFENELAAAAQLAQNHPEAHEPLGKLIRAFDQLPVSLLTSPRVMEALKAHDAQFATAFGELGEKKAKIRRPSSTARVAAYVHRAQELPLADVKLTGEVAAGSATAAATLRLEALMPASFRSYEKHISKLSTRLRVKRLRPGDVEDLDNAVVESAVLCKRVHDEWADATAGLARCAFATTPCPEESTARWETSLTDVEVRAKAAWVATELAVSSLPAERRHKGRSAAQDVCPSP